jgi:hypothetical protein
LPKKLNFDNELRKIDAQMAADPTHLWPFLARVRTPLYQKMIVDCIAHNEQPLAHRIVDILSDYYARKEALRSDRTGSGDPTGLGLTDDTADSVKALSILWNMSVQDTVRKIIDRYADTLLEQEFNNRNRRKEVLK